MDPSPPGKINAFDFCKVWVCTCRVKSKNIIVEMYNEKCKMQNEKKNKASRYFYNLETPK